MKKFGCTSPFGHFGYLNNICTDNATGKQAFDMFEELDDDNFVNNEFKKQKQKTNCKSQHAVVGSQATGTSTQKAR